MEELMKTTIITTLGLILLLAGTYRLQAAEMNHPVGKDGGMGTSQSMQGEYDTSPSVPADAAMKQDANKMAHETMKGTQTMIPSDEELRKRLTPLQYQVTRKDGTEPPYNNAYWDNHEPGLYVDIISGVPLFSSLDKYDSGTGWPSFTRPLDPAAIVNKQDRSFFSVRTEIRSKSSDAHLGHVFDDGPPPTGLRYCMNSAALRFIPKADLAKEGYGDYVKLFK
jgi:methionine-R-sulfoxide reductase